MNLLAFACLIFTLLSYAFTKRLYRCFPYLIFSPAILAPTMIIVFIYLADISYTVYMQDNQWVVWMLGPATIAFAVPIYESRHLIKTHILSIGMGVFIGMSAGMLSAYYLAQLFHFNQSTTLSLMARSISTPFAMELTSHIGGSVELVIIFTLMTGLIGICFGDLILAMLKLKSHFTLGASLGNAAHGFGTAKAFMRHPEEGIVASLSMILSGVFMVIAGPYAIQLILYLA